MLCGEHSVVYGHPCLVTAVDLRLSVTVTLHDQASFLLDAVDLGLAGYQKSLSQLGQGEIPREARFLEVAYHLFLEAYPQSRGVRVETRNEFSASYGLGSSSASTVAFLFALAAVYGVVLHTFELFSLAYRTVLQVQGSASGFDLAAAIWGGTMYYRKPTAIENRPTVIPLTVPNLPLVVGYTGVKADTATLITQVANQYENNRALVESLWEQIAQLVESAKQALLVGDWSAFGVCCTKNQQLLTRLQVSSPVLEKLITTSLGAGAFGAKLSGAGGGDCMFAVVSPENRMRVEQALQQVGGTLIATTLHADPVRLEKV